MRFSSILAGLFILLFCFPLASLAQDEPPAVDESPAPEKTPPPHAIGLSLLGGFTALPMLDYRYDLRSYNEREDIYSADDESTLDPNAVVGLSFAWFPQDVFFNFGFVMEALADQYTGDMTGRIKMAGTLRRNYQYDQRVTFYQLNWLMKVYFNNEKLRPFLDAGIGAVRADLDLNGYEQTSYGGTVIMGWGAEYRFSDRFGLSLQARLTDHFGLVFYHRPYPDERATIEANYIPLTFMLGTHLYLF